MITCGVDLGSLTTKAVVFDTTTHQVCGSKLLASGAPPEAIGQRALDEALVSSGRGRQEVGAIVGTGYGRVTLEFATRRVTEITCHARGVHFHLPEVRTIIDIGGQDSKVIRVDGAGRVLDFDMNDRCAAGTGRFLEVMAQVLGGSLPDFMALALAATDPVRISSTCTVFAESEVVGLLAQGRERADVAAGLCEAVAQRVAGMVWRLGLEAPVAFTGGVALNEPVRQALGRQLGTAVAVAPEPQLTGALGAALLAAENGAEAC